MDQTPWLPNNNPTSAPLSNLRQAESTIQELPFYKLLEILERTKRWSERDVLQRLAIPRTTYRGWRDGSSEPSKRAYWIKLSKVFGVPIDVLIRADLNFFIERNTNHVPITC